jgi:hypothetical protein
MASQIGTNFTYRQNDHGSFNCSKYFGCRCSVIVTIADLFAFESSKKLRKRKIDRWGGLGTENRVFQSIARPRIPFSG